MAPSDFGPKTKMMEQKAFWMRTKMCFTFTMNKMIHGSNVASKAEDQGKVKERDAVERTAAEAAAVGDSLNLDGRRKAIEDRNQSDDWSWQTEEAWWWQDGWYGQPDAADSWQSWGQESAHEHADSYKSKGKGKKGKQGKKGKDGKDKKGSSNVVSLQPEAQAAVDTPSLPSSFFPLHHVGSPTTVGEPEMAGATFGGPVNTGGEPGDGGPVTAEEPADGGAVTAGEPDVVPDADADQNEPDDVAQPVDDDDGEPVEGSSSNDEEPETPWGSLHTQRRDTW